MAIRDAAIMAEVKLLDRLRNVARLTPSAESNVWQSAYHLVNEIRDKQKDQSGIDALLQEFSLSSEEGVVLMCLAEALLRIPDAATQDRMIQDRLGTGDWAAHLGHSDSIFVNASAWGLLLTGKVLGLSSEENANLLERTVGRMGEPVIRASMRYAMQIMGAQFVMGSDIESALARARDFESRGYSYSYDMLGEGARTMKDADRYFEQYSNAIECIGRHALKAARAPGISVKLSALHPRYEPRQHKRVLTELAGRLRMLMNQASDAGIGLTVDAEESWRLDLSLEVIESVLVTGRPADWPGFGLAIQAYQKQGYDVVGWAAQVARQHNRRLSVRLVKGAYWDTEIKYAQERGYSGYAVFTTKSATDVSYQACARLLMNNRDCLFPQFATHNAYTFSAVRQLELETGESGGYEFQRLHGMGEELYDDLVDEGIPCRIYAPVGEHADLLAYLVRRLLENGANTSFVNNIQNRALPLNKLLEDPVRASKNPSSSISLPTDLYLPHRVNSNGMDLDSYQEIHSLSDELSGLPQDRHWGEIDVRNPASLDEVIGRLSWHSNKEMTIRLEKVVSGAEKWAAKPVQDRADFLLRIAHHLEEEQPEYIRLCICEAGKTLDDAIAEIREAIDFCRYYAAEALTLDAPALGVVLCISPWNFPLAIFLGQVCAALVAGNVVLAKPAEQTSLIASRLVRAMHQCGVPETALQLVVSPGAPVSATLLPDVRVNGVMFTGSTLTAKSIARILAERNAPLIAETGGLNAMIVDSTALAEQVVDDVVASAFMSAGQRCSALRLLYVQEDVADEVIEKISGKMMELVVGDPRSFETDIGPIIDRAAQARLDRHIDHLEAGGVRQICRTPVSAVDGYFFAPALYEIADLTLLQQEVFGPVLHVKRFAAGSLQDVVDEINAGGYGLTFGIHSRIESRCRAIADLMNVGNVYINRNTVGAVVGVQPFGGRGKSGTGPKAGGPAYLPALVRGDDDVLPGGNEPVVVCFDDELAPAAVFGWRSLSMPERLQTVRLLLHKLLALHIAVDADDVMRRFSEFADEATQYS